ncbi:MAG TPA: hypothetical protein VGV87_27120 [Blastocatellia bacterium]|nr:hypothetical protein [Blastocatellia bacterium]
MAPDHQTVNTRHPVDSQTALSLRTSLLIGGLGFSLISLGIFATVAFAERWMYSHLGVSGAYLVWTILFILFGGLVFSLLVVEPNRRLRFHALFAGAFFSYAVGWVGAYFTVRGLFGEWLGSFLGSALMALVIAAGFGVLRSAPNLSALLFITNSAGYFFGSVLNDILRGKIGMLLWGAVYGLFLGAGLGAALYVAQSQRAHSPMPESETLDA